MKTIKVLLKWSVVLTVAILLLSPGAQAQERGQYLPGFRGLNAGSQPPPGFTYANYFFWYPTDTLKNRHGDSLNVDFDLDLLADMNVFAYTTKAKFAGANYGFVVAVPITNAAVSLPRLGHGFSTLGLADIYVELLIGMAGRCNLQVRANHKSDRKER